MAFVMGFKGVRPMACDMQAQLTPTLIQQGGKLRAVWRAHDAANVKNVDDSHRRPRHPFTTPQSGVSEDGSSADASDIAQREIEVQARFEALYKDDVQRRIRKEKRIAEHVAREDSRTRSMQIGSSRNSVSARRWEDRYIELCQLQAEKERKDEMMRNELERQREFDEMQECSFRPHINASPKQRAHSEARRKADEVGKRLAERQKCHLHVIQNIQQEEVEFDDRMKGECEVALAKTSEESHKTVDAFLQGEEGQRELCDRARAYQDANPGIDEDRAFAEAKGDIVHASSQNLRSKVLAEFKDRRQVERKRFQIRRLQVIHELVKLEAEWNRAIAKLPLCARTQAFDPDLVAKMKQEPWYLIARHTVSQITSGPA